MIAAVGYSETSRQAVHIAMGGFALFLRYIPWWQAAVLAAAALCFNLLILPRVWPRLYRPADRTGRPGGIVLYPVAVLLLILVFPHRPDIAAAAWGILAVGDGSATLVGRAVRGRRLPWNREKSVAGSVAFVVLGGLAGAFLAWWCQPAVDPTPYPWFSVIVPFVAALVAGAAESLPIRLDDNISVPVASAATLWAGSLVSEDVLLRALPDLVRALPFAVLLNGGAAAAGYLVRAVSGPGAITGAIIGTTIFATAGWAGWLLLLATLAAATISSRMGLRRKQLLGIAEERGGRRGPGNALANTGLAAVAAIVAVVSHAPDAATVAFTAALVAAGSDTIASEIGKAWGRTTWLPTTFERVAPGTPGAISLEGTAAGLVGAMALGAIAVAAGLVASQLLVAIVAGATIGAFVESCLGAALEGPGILNNDVLNLVNTAVAAFSAVMLQSLL